MDWQKYKRKGEIEARPYKPGEDLTGVSVSKEDTPKAGDMIARNPDNLNDQWLIAEAYFRKNYEV